MAFGADFVPVFLYFAIRADEKCAAHDSQERFAEEFLHASHAIGFDSLEARITEKIEVQFVLGFECGLGFDRVAARAEDYHAKFIELLLCVAKLGRFNRSTGGIGFWIEEEDYSFAAKIGERDIGACVVFQTECGSFIAFF